jgi:hypothetical protein
MLPFFIISYEEALWERYEQHRSQRKRKPGAGQKGRLNTMEKKLFFILYYLSKANPNPTLTEVQVAENRQMSRVRVVVENAICRMKRFSSLTAPFRNHKDSLVDDVALVTAGLANWMLSVHSASPA